ncbi:MAG: AAA family ATPase [Deltaproteobacteria bacterium]|nr:AAA family ATPase [Deltaproteobacteria bacterium]
MTYVFNDFRLDCRDDTLRRGAKAIRLEPTSTEILKYLIEHRDRVVTKHELLENIWHDSTVSEAVLHVSVSKLRRSLGQERGQQQPIRTEHGVGYRFITEVIPVSNASGELREVYRFSPTTSDRSANPFIGREEIMRKLTVALDQAASGWSQLFIIQGEAGIGKTRIAKELAMIAERKQIGVWFGRCLEHLSAPAFWPWYNAMREAIKDLPPETIWTLDKRCIAQLSQLIPELGQQEVEPVELSRVNASNAKYRLYDAITKILLSASDLRTRLLILDDLHCSDTASLELMVFMASQLSEGRILVVGTLRDKELAVAHENRKSLEALLRMRECQRIELVGLQKPDVARYIEQLTRGVVPEEVSTAVFQKTGGNPFFVQKAVQLLLSKLGSSDLSGIQPADVILPREVRDFSKYRIDGLDADTRSLLEIGSVIGKSFDLIRLHQITRKPLDGILLCLDTAEKLGLVTQEHEVGTYAFSHELIGEVLYQGLSSTGRARLHRRVAEALEGVLAKGSSVNEIAYHFYQALPDGQYEKAIQYALRSAAEMSSVFAYREAATQYQRAVRALDFHPHPDIRQRCELNLARVVALGNAGLFEEARAVSEQVTEIARQHQLPEVLVQAGVSQRFTLIFAPIPDPNALIALQHALQCLPAEAIAERSRALSYLAWMPPNAHNMERSRQLSAEALELARGADDPSVLLDALAARAYALTDPDHIGELLEVSEHMLELMEQQGVYHWPMSDAHVIRIRAFLQLGDMAAVDTELEDMRRTAIRYGIESTKEYSDRLRVQIFLFQRGHFQEAESRYRELDRKSYLSQVLPLLLNDLFRRIAQRALQGKLNEKALSRDLESQWPWIQSYHQYYAQRAAFFVAVGDFEKAAEELAKVSKDDFGHIPRNWDFLSTLTLLAIAAFALRDRPNARLLYNLMSPYAHLNATNILCYYTGSVSYYLGILSHLLDERQQAAGHFENALRMSREYENPIALAWTQFSYGRMLAEDSSRASRARSQRLIDDAMKTAERLGIRLAHPRE